MKTGMLHTHSSFNNRVVTLTKIGQKFISATSQGVTQQFKTKLLLAKFYYFHVACTEKFYKESINNEINGQKL